MPPSHCGGGFFLVRCTCMTDLEKSIIKTLAFFDIFNFPMTELEIWKWLFKPGRKVELSELRDVLGNSENLKKHISLREGFYCLKGSEQNYLRRKQNNNFAERKFSKAIRVIKIFRFIPFIRMVAVCNTLAYSNAREESDIDLFIISKKGKIWLARFFSILIIKLLKIRPQKDNKQDTICLSFFVDETGLDIKNVMMSDKDIYFPYWVQQLMPIYDPDGLYEKFMEANSWYKDYLPNAYSNKFSKQVRASKSSKVFGKFFGNLISPKILGSWLDDIYRSFQIRIIDRNLKSMVNVDTRVIINEQMLKFHADDRREMFFKQWKEKINKILKK